MKSIKSFSLFIIFNFIVVSITFAQNVKSIQLQDGSTLKGKVVALEGGVYTIQTQNLGTIELNEEEILNIGSNQTNTPAPSGNIDYQMQQMQRTMMSDPSILEDIQELAEDPEFLKIIQDPEFMNAVQQKDVNKLENNPSANQLMKNPKMKNLIDKINSQMN